MRHRRLQQPSIKKTFWAKLKQAINLRKKKWSQLYKITKYFTKNLCKKLPKMNILKEQKRDNKRKTRKNAQNWKWVMIKLQIRFQIENPRIKVLILSKMYSLKRKNFLQSYFMKWSEKHQIWIGLCLKTK